MQCVLTHVVNGRARAVGIVATDGHSRVHVNACNKCVVVAAGSLRTPCLLQQSGFRNPHIGRHLHLHLVTAAVGFFNETIHPYLGAPTMAVCDQFPSVKLECPFVHTGLAAAALPYWNPHDYKEKMLRFKHSAVLVAVQRDTVSEGRVRLNDDGFSPSIDYGLKEPKELSMMNALKGAVKFLSATGANHVSTYHNDDPGFQLSDESYENAVDIETSDKV